MSKLRIEVGPERRIRIFVLAKTWIEDDYMYVRSDKGDVFRRSVSYFPSVRYGWEEYEGERNA